MAIYTLAADERVRFAKILAPGNTCDVTIAELLGELADDPAAGTLCFLLESLADGRAFVEQARAVDAGHGRWSWSRPGSRRRGRGRRRRTPRRSPPTPRSGGACSGRPGSSRSRSGQELLDAARALDGHPLPAGPRVAIITNSGGVGVELSDLLADEGLTVPALSAPLQDKIRAMLPPFASPANPVDVTPVWSRFAELYPALTDLLARSGEVDVVVPVLLQRAALDAKTAEGLRDVVAGLRADDVACRCTCAGWRPVTRGPTPTSCRTRACRASTGPPAPPGRSGTPAATPWLARGRHPRPRPRGAVGADAHRPGARGRAAGRAGRRHRAVDRSAAQPTRPSPAATAFPVVVKLAEAAHRTELGGVRLDLADAAAVRAAAAELLRTGPGAGAAAAVRGGDRRRGRCATRCSGRS